jgi:hypothetical protein
VSGEGKATGGKLERLRFEWFLVTVDRKVVTLTCHSSAENEAIQDEARQTAMSEQALILLA